MQEGVEGHSFPDIHLILLTAPLTDGKTEDYSESHAAREGK
jgi:hypothetical protein